MWRFAGGAIKKFRLSSRLNVGSTIDVEILAAAGALERLTPGSLQAVEINREPVQQVRIDRLVEDSEGRWIVCRPIDPDPIPPSIMHPTVVQRRARDSVT